ncbi:hypothetical protein T439DRAFT_354889 [Meredithblackwellia eburnea MCA 4105]
MLPSSASLGNAIYAQPPTVPELQNMSTIDEFLNPPDNRSPEELAAWDEHNHRKAEAKGWTEDPRVVNAIVSFIRLHGLPEGFVKPLKEDVFLFFDVRVCLLMDEPPFHNPALLASPPKPDDPPWKMVNHDGTVALWILTLELEEGETMIKVVFNIPYVSEDRSVKLGE